MVLLNNAKIFRYNQHDHIGIFPSDEMSYRFIFDIG
jgi:hypothetical protein